MYMSIIYKIGIHLLFLEMYCTIGYIKKNCLKKYSRLQKDIYILIVGNLSWKMGP